MTTKTQKKHIIHILLLLFCLTTIALAEFLLHRRFIFLWDDLWYSTNLVTNQPLHSLRDIWTSQCWHFMNWGGRNITHGLLQFIIMQGELFADILNLIVTFTLSYLICKLADTKSLLLFCISFFSLFTLNADIKLSMFWQSGSANYLYSTNWILLFLIVYLRELKESNARPLRLITLWILPLGLITGWSTENMGPACFISSLLTVLYHQFYLKKKTPFWMWEGVIFSFLGSILVIVAPGNFIRSSNIAPMPLGELLYERFFMMLMAGMSFLFPTLICLTIFLFLYLQTGNRLLPYQIILFITAVLAYGAMILSPTFPARATFGIMSLCIVLIISFIKAILTNKPQYKSGILIYSLCLWLLGIYNLISCIILPI